MVAPGPARTHREPPAGRCPRRHPGGRGGYRRLAILFGIVFFYLWRDSLTGWLDRGETKEVRWVLIPILMIVVGAVIFLAIQPARAEEAQQCAHTPHRLLDELRPDRATSFGGLRGRQRPLFAQGAEQARYDRDRLLLALREYEEPARGSMNRSPLMPCRWKVRTG